MKENIVDKNYCQRFIGCLTNCHQNFIGTAVWKIHSCMNWNAIYYKGTMTSAYMVGCILNGNWCEVKQHKQHATIFMQLILLCGVDGS